MRNCVSGEELTSNLACLACTNGTFGYDAPIEISQCEACNPNAICFGKNVSAPQPGYWRANDTSNSWVECPRVTSCLGGNESEPMGVCAAGYTGTVCGECEENYSSTADFTCAECPPKIRNTFQIVLIFLFVALYAAFLVRSTMKSATAEKPVYAVYLKIMTNHF